MSFETELIQQITTLKNSKALSHAEKSIVAERMQHHLLMISIICQEEEWHQTDKLVREASAKLEQMLDDGYVTQKKY